MRHPKATLKVDHDADLLTYVRDGACPVCGDANYLEATHGEETYLDDEGMLLTQYGPRWYPYKEYTCGNCGAEWRVYSGPVKVELTKDADAMGVKV